MSIFLYFAAIIPGLQIMNIYVSELFLNCHFQVVEQLTEKCQQLQAELKDCSQECKQLQAENTRVLTEMEALRSKFTLSLLSVSRFTFILVLGASNKNILLLLTQNSQCFRKNILVCQLIF